MKTLLIDDMKLPEELGVQVERIARTFADGIAALEECRWDRVLLDHDLADFSGPQGQERTGFHVLLWLARPENRAHIPSEISCVSRNPTGGVNIVSAIDDLYADPDRLVMRDGEYMRRLYADND